MPTNSPTPAPPNPPVFENSPLSHIKKVHSLPWKWISLTLVLVVLTCLIVLKIVISQNLLLLHQLSDYQLPSVAPTVTPSLTAASPISETETTNWQTYTNTKYGYSLKYPVNEGLRQFTCGTSWGEVGGEETFALDNSELRPCELQEWYYPIQIDVIKGNEVDVRKPETLLEKKHITIDNLESTYYHVRPPVNDEVGYPDYFEIRTYYNNHTYIFTLVNTDYQPIFDHILSTFKFLDEESYPASPAPTSVQSYLPDNKWQTVNIPDLNISICLPPKWELNENQPGSIDFNRDPAYKPRATYITSLPYLGGSRRNEYINSKVQYEYEPDTLKAQTKVTELNINGKPALKIAIPSFPEVIVIAEGNKLYAVNSDYQPLVNDSRSAFQKDIYTIVGCIQSL